MDRRELLLKMAKILDEKGALNITLLDVEHLTSITRSEEHTSELQSPDCIS